MPPQIGGGEDSHFLFTFLTTFTYYMCTLTSSGASWVTTSMVRSEGACRSQFSLSSRWVPGNEFGLAPSLSCFDLVTLRQPR